MDADPDLAAEVEAARAPEPGALARMQEAVNRATAAERAVNRLRKDVDDSLHDVQASIAAQLSAIELETRRIAAYQATVVAKLAILFAVSTVIAVTAQVGATAAVVATLLRRLDVVP